MVRTGLQKIAHRLVKRSRQDEVCSDFSEGFKNEAAQMEAWVWQLQTVRVDGLIACRQDIEIQRAGLPGVLCRASAAILQFNVQYPVQERVRVQAAGALQDGIQIIRLGGRTLLNVRRGFPNAGNPQDTTRRQAVDAVQPGLKMGQAVAEVRSQGNMIEEGLRHADTKSGPQDGSCGPL